MDRFDEAELKVQTTQMYIHGGIANVLACVSAMQKCQIVILQKLNELMREEYDRSNRMD